MARSTTRRPSWRAAAPAFAAVAVLGLAACSNGEEPTDNPGTTPPVFTGSPAPATATEGSGHGGSGTESASETGAAMTADLSTPEGRGVGEVTFTEQGDGVVAHIVLEGLPAGYRGVHVHAVGKCEPNSEPPTGGEPGNFLSAGGHLQARGNTGMPESGDLGAVVVRDGEKADVTVVTNAFTLDDLTGGEGTSVVVHTEAATGDRLACGVVSGT